ncbi:hypothetical protein V2J09_019782 [Rumex salicifolius]
MARGKIQIRRIENATNRQVTYSKRRTGLIKKANELTVLCDANVSIIMFSSTNKLHEFTSPNTTTKEIYDAYQKGKEIDIWSSHYANMQDELRNLKEANRQLQKEISRRMGYCLEDMNSEELIFLQKDMENAATIIGKRKYKALENQINTTKKKRSLSSMNKSMSRNVYTFCSNLIEK